MWGGSASAKASAIAPPSVAGASLRYHTFDSLRLSDGSSLRSLQSSLSFGAPQASAAPVAHSGGAERPPAIAEVQLGVSRGVSPRVALPYIRIKMGERASQRERRAPRSRQDRSVCCDDVAAVVSWQSGSRYIAPQLAQVEVLSVVTHILPVNPMRYEAAVLFSMLLEACLRGAIIGILQQLFLLPMVALPPSAGDDVEA